MIIKNEKPPIYEECVKAFGIDKRKGIVFTYGDCLYNPDGLDLPDHILVHESVHGNQQKHDDTVAKLWWERYIVDVKFRIEQEVEAYGAQYKFICEKVKDRNARYKSLHILAQDLSGDMYGRCLSYTDAIIKIKKEAIK